MSEFEEALPQEVITALEQGRKIEAIKLLRERQGIGLKEAKEAVERYQPQRRSGGSSVVQSAGGSGLAWLLVLVVAGVAAAWLLGWL